MVMSTRKLGFAAALCALTIAGCRHESLPQAISFELHDAWARAVPDSGSTTAAYIRFVNGTSDTVVVSGFSSDDARAVELHQSSIGPTGEASMARRDSLVIAPSHTVVMKPGAYHLMLIGTTHAFTPGQMVRIVMHLSDGTIVSTSARVQS
jgi:copper(I)-binding protein